MGTIQKVINLKITRTLIRPVVCKITIFRDDLVGVLFSFFLIIVNLRYVIFQVSAHKFSLTELLILGKFQTVLLLSI